MDRCGGIQSVAAPESLKSAPMSVAVPCLVVGTGYLLRCADSYGTGRNDETPVKCVSQAQHHVRVMARCKSCQSGLLSSPNSRQTCI